MNTEKLQRSLQKIRKENRKLTQYMRESEIDIKDKKTLSIILGALGFLLIGIGISVVLTRNKNIEAESEETTSDEDTSVMEETDPEDNNSSLLGSAKTVVQNIQNTTHRYLHKIRRR